MTSRILPLLLAAACLAGEGHSHGPQPASAPTGPVVVGPEARRNLRLETARAEVRPLGEEVAARAVLRPATGSHAIVVSVVPARVTELRAAPGAALAAGAPVLVVQPLVAGAGRVVLPAPVAGTLLGWASKGCETETFKPVAIQGEPCTPM